MQQCHSANARYLFQQDKFYDVSYDTGDKSLQCGRKVDVFKLWLMWKARGNEGFERRIDNAFENARSVNCNNQLLVLQSMLVEYNVQIEIEIS